jgi:phage repressor protein C with HTH and peptisase S24 domain
MAVNAMSRKLQAALPEWSTKIHSLRRLLRLSQSEFSKQLHFSAMSASRWERGTLEPSERAYIRIGNLAGDPLCWYFWRRAGLSTADVMRVLPEANRRLTQNRIPRVQVVHAGEKINKPKHKADFVAVPLLPVTAATPGAKGAKEEDIDQIQPERLLAAPKVWCPHPASTVCMRVKGNSMSPLILDGYIIAVDTSEVRHEKLIGQIVVAQNMEKGLLVSRLIRFDHTDALVSDHREYNSISVTAASEWRIVGKVLWWTGRAR